MGSMTSEEFDALTRTDFNVFVERVFAELNPATTYKDNFHIAIMCAKLEAVRRCQIKRLIINVPPRSLKSIIASVAFPAFVLGHNPAAKFIAASYGQDLAETLSRDCRQVMASDWYRRAFPAAAISPLRHAVNDFETTSGGGRLATSVGGAITGLGGDFIVIDDPTKPADALSDLERNKANDWYDHTLVSRLNDKLDGAIVVVMQRLHEDDFVAHIMELDEWQVLSFPAIAQEDERHLVDTPYGQYVHLRAEGEALHEARESLESLSRTQRTMGAAYFSAQYLQTPMTPGGTMIKADWFPKYDPDHAPKFERIVQSWDTSNKAKELNDYSVCTTWGVKEKHCYLISVFRKKLEYPDLKRAVREQAALHSATTIIIEDRASGTQLIQELRAEGLSGLTAYEPKGEKVMRVHAQIGRMEGGFVHLPNQAHWLEDYLHELMVFPKGRNDDQVDSTVQLLDSVHSYSSFDVWKAIMEARIAHQRGETIPTIRIRHKNPGMALSTITGRQLRPDADGIMVLTEEEWAPLRGGAAGFYLADEGG